MNLPGMTTRTVVGRLWRLGSREGEELSYAAAVSIWVRWLFILGTLAETWYRVEFGSLSHVLNTLYLLGIMAPTAWVQWRIHRSGRVAPRWLLALSVIDIACLSLSVSLSGGFDSRYFPMYYFALAMFAWIFTSPWLVFTWTTMTAAIYVGICLAAADGIDLGLMEEKALFYRLLVMYGTAVSVNLITRFERARRLAAVQRERELNRQRIEMSHSIHDTTAQSAYMLGLGLEEAVERTDRSDPELAEKLAGMWALSRSAMWDLRHPIDGGRIFSGSGLGEVLAAHADTFTVVTSIPAELRQRGVEPELSDIQRSLLFSIAHNALTNVFRHSGADCVVITLDFEDDGLRLSVSDDGNGLPRDYAGRGHGFRNMRADARRMEGRLEVESNEHGTTVSCAVPYDRD